MARKPRKTPRRIWVDSWFEAEGDTPSVFHRDAVLVPPDFDEQCEEVRTQLILLAKNVAMRGEMANAELLMKTASFIWNLVGKR